MRKIFFTSIILLFSSIYLFAFETPYFKGYTGFLGNFSSNPGEEGFDPCATAQGYFAGQLDFSDKLLVRGEFFVQSADLFGGDIFHAPESADALFKVQEVSAVYKLNKPSATHYFSAFFGEYEPIGSDTFLRRQFGIKPITSGLTTSFHGLNGASINHMYGGGLSYIIHLPRQIAAGVYAYEDWNKAYNQRSFNTDMRIGGALPFITFDFNSGIGFPKDSTDGTFDNYFFIVRYVTLHSGFNLLIGNPSSDWNIFLQGGFSDLPVSTKRDDDLFDFKTMAKNLYFLFEPRINMGQFSAAVTLFNIPYQQLDNLIYTKDSCGVDLSVKTNNLYIGDMNATVGAHLSFTLGSKTNTRGKTIKDAWDDRKNSSDRTCNVRLTPYAEVPVLGGSLHASMTTDLTHLAKFKSDWPSSFEVRVGFKTQF